MLCTLLRWSANILLLLILCAGCVPVPVSTVALYPRQERPVALESALSENFGIFSAVTFDTTGGLLAVYDSGSNLIRILRSADLALVDSHQSTRRPRRLSFSLGGRFLIIEQYQGWIDDFLSTNRDKRHPSSSHVDIDSAEAIQDNIQRVEIWDLRNGRTIPDLSCDAVQTAAPEGGLLWAQRWATVKGSRSSALLEAHFSPDENVFSVLCWNGVQQRWHTQSWNRLEDLPPPSFWGRSMGWIDVKWLANASNYSQSTDGRIVSVAPRPHGFHWGFPLPYLWDKGIDQLIELQGECAVRVMPINAFSRDGSRIALGCGKGMGYTIRVWELGSGKERILQDAEYSSFAGGAPSITPGGVALSPEGKHLAVALLGQEEFLLANVLLAPLSISRSDLRLLSVDSGNELVAVSIDDLVRSSGYFDGVHLAFSPDGTTLAVAGRRLRLYRVDELIGQK